MSLADDLRFIAAQIARGEERYICHGLRRLYGCPLDLPNSKAAYAERFLSELGMPLSGGGFSGALCDPFPVRFEYGERQQIRATWCEFAADIAEEWGIE